MKNAAKGFLILAVAVLCCGMGLAQQAASDKDKELSALQEQVEKLRKQLLNPDRDNLLRYAEANRRLTTAAAAGWRVVFLGDSITDGWRLEEFFSNRSFINRGISGQITGQMLGRFKQDVIDLKPAAVVILAGTNDIARGVSETTIENNIEMMAALAKAYGIKPILASILPISDYHKDKDPRREQSKLRPPEKILAVNRWIKSFCERESFTYLDYHSKLVDANGFLPADLANDGLHPNEKGYEVMAPVALQAIEKTVYGAGQTADPELNGKAEKDVILRGGNVMSCETYSLRQLFKEGKLTLETAPAFYKTLGIKGMSLNDMFFKSWDETYLDKIKAAARQQDRIITALIMEGNLAQADEARRRAALDTAKMKLRAAHRLGAPIVRINLGATGQGDEADATVGVERVIAAFKELLPMAKEFNIKITIENHGGVSKTADGILRIIKGTDPHWVGSCLDFGNWPDSVRYEECQKLAPYAYHTHAKSYSFNGQGEETKIDYKRVLDMLKAAHYKGALSIEFEGRGDPVEGVKKTRDLVAKYW